jgi:hypothetical protein
MATQLHNDHPVPADLAEDDFSDIIDDEADASIAVELVEAAMANPTAAETPVVDTPGADTEGLDAAPSEQATRVGAGAAGDFIGLEEEAALASDLDGGDGSDIDAEVDPENPKDLVDLIGGADSTGTQPRP